MAVWRKARIVGASILEAMALREGVVTGVGTVAYQRDAIGTSVELWRRARLWFEGGMNSCVTGEL